MTIQSINPATEEVLATFDEATPKQIDEALTAARAGFSQWRVTSSTERSRALHQTSPCVGLRRLAVPVAETAAMGCDCKGLIDACNAA